MTTSRWQNWRDRRRQRRAHRQLQQQRPGQLREFIYLDEVSVTSLLSSRLGKVPSEFTDAQTDSLKTELNASISANAGIVKSAVGSRLEGSRTNDTKVVSKATIQTSFSNLFDGECESLPLKVHKPRPQAPTLDMARAILATTGDGSSPWRVSSDRLLRGDLIEVEVELQAEPTFQVSTIIAVLADLLDESKTLRSYTNRHDLERAVEMNTILGKLMAGLVPLRCRLSDYVAITTGGQEELMHREVLQQLPAEETPLAREIYLVGVAEEALFWKDLRRVLFTQSRFRVLCRLNHDGLTNTWESVKLLDVLGDVASGLREQMRVLGPNALNNITALAARRTQISDPRHQALVTYSELMATELGITLDENDRRTIETAATDAADQLTSVPASRAAFRKITQIVEGDTGKTVDPTLAAQLRALACEQHHLHPGGSQQQHASSPTVASYQPNDHRFIDAEIIAIYW